MIAYHLVMGCYGFWLPNDPRGSGSDYVGSKALMPYGLATKIHTNRSVAHVAHDECRRREAKGALLHPPVRLDGRQAREVARGFREAAVKDGIVAHACAVMPDHAHLVVACHPHLTPPQLLTRFKSSASRTLRESGLHPFADAPRPDGSLPKLWGRSGRHVYLDTAEEVVGRIRYVEDNPVEIGFPRQRWSFVVPLRATVGSGGESE